jgi:hypothetical protein
VLDAASVFAAPITLVRQGEETAKEERRGKGRKGDLLRILEPDSSTAVTTHCCYTG